MMSPMVALLGKYPTISLVGKLIFFFLVAGEDEDSFVVDEKLQHRAFSFCLKARQDDGELVK